MNHEDRERAAEKSPPREGTIRLEPDERDIFARWLSILNGTSIPYLVGGAFAIHKHTGIWRFTKDLDVFVSPRDLKTAIDALSAAGFATEVRDRYWLAKATSDSYLLDLIFSIGYSYITVDDTWFVSPPYDDIAGVRVPVMGVEELIASKVYVTRSDRFDGADIVHVIKAVEGNVRWDRLLHILKDDGVLLLWYLLLFSYVYPGHTAYLPHDLMADLFAEAQAGWSHPRDPKSFYGMMIDPGRFRVDVTDWGYIDEREPRGPLVDEEGKPI